MPGTFDQLMFGSTRDWRENPRAKESLGGDPWGRAIDIIANRKALGIQGELSALRDKVGLPQGYEKELWRTLLEAGISDEPSPASMFNIRLKQAKEQPAPKYDGSEMRPEDFEAARNLMIELMMK